MSLRKDSVCSSMSTSRAPSATSYVSSTTYSHNLENGEADETIKVDQINKHVTIKRTTPK